MNVKLTGSRRLPGGKTAIPFLGSAAGAFFTGTVEPGAEDTQQWKGVSIAGCLADCTLTGQAHTGESCRIHVVNTSPDCRHWTPSPETRCEALSFLNQNCQAFVTMRPKGPFIRIFCGGAPPMNLTEQTNRLKSDIPAVFIALKDPDTPWYAKLLAALTVCYALSPIDLIPDFIPVLGYLDDLLILPALVALTVKGIPKEVWERSRRAAEGLWSGGMPEKWYYSLPIALLWAALLLWLWKTLR